MDKKRLRILFFGNPGYGGAVLEELLKQNIEIVGVFHQTQNKFFQLKKFLRHNFLNFKRAKITYKKVIHSNKFIKKMEKFFDEKFDIPQFDKNVIEIAKEKKIQLFDTSELYKKKSLIELKKLDIDLILVASFSELIPRNILNIARVGSINIHPSLLPKYRWSIPEFCAIYNGEAKTGITFHLMNIKFDSGNIILQKELDILNTDTTISLKIKLADLMCRSLKDFFHIIDLGNLQGKPQDESKSTYCKIKIDSDYIHKDLTVKQIKNIINAHHGVSYEPYCKIKSKKIYVLAYNKNGFSYECKDGQVKFNIIRYRNKIYRKDEIEKLGL